nr:trichohyalin-like [Pocillopora verrucosa]
MNCTIESQMVFYDAANGDESIELVNSSLETNASSQETESERTDIVEAQVLPKNTKGRLYFSNQEGLDASRNKVQSRPKIDEQIKGHMTTLSEILENPDFADFHHIVKEVNEKLLGAIDYAAKNSTSLNAVTELLGSCFAVLLEACHGVADKFELSDDTVEALADFKRCERERYDLLKKTEMDRAVDKREEGVTLLEQAMTKGKEDVKKVLERQKKTEEAQTLQKFLNKSEELEQEINREIEELKLMSDNCEADVAKIAESLDTLRESAEIALKKYTQRDQNLCQKLQQNRKEQEELQKRLNALKENEQKLEEEREKENNTQKRADSTAMGAEKELEKWRQQIQELQDRCQAALHVMEEFRDGSSKLMDASVESKKKEERELHKLDIMAHRRLRDATAAAAVECQQHIEDCDKNIKFLKDTITSLKAERKAKAKIALKVVVDEIVEKLKKYEESYSESKQARAEKNQKFDIYTKEMQDLDERLEALGEIVEAFDEIYRRVQREVNALWEGEDFSSLED